MAAHTPILEMDAAAAAPDRAAAAANAAAAEEAPPADGADQCGDGNASAMAARGKKPAWSKPTNGAIDTSPVMGAVSWPALSESTKASPKLSVSRSSDAPPPTSPGPLISSSPKKPSSNAQSPSSSKGHTALGRQRSMKRGGEGGGGSGSSSANGGLALGSEERSASEPSPKEVSGKNGDHGFRANLNEHHRNYGGGGRRGNSGGNGQQHSNNSRPNRRDHDWNRQAMNGLDGHMHQPRGPRPFHRPLVMSSAPPYMPPPPPPPPMQGQHFPTRFLIHADMPPPIYFPPPESLSPMPFVAPMPSPPVFIPIADPLRSQLLQQIEYYFSPGNLCKDLFLRQNMDEQGWIDVSLIAGFNRVKLLTNNTSYILETVQHSSVVEVQLQGEKIRRRIDWMNWILPQTNQFVTPSGPHSPATQNQDLLASEFRNIGLEDGASSDQSMTALNLSDGGLSRSSSASVIAQSQILRNPSFDGYGNVIGHADSGWHPRAARSLTRSDTL